ncbi:MAG: membrane integrity-associated transporter subunit PqiC [Clostridia bacterium]|nr:membrane integrity-associated transporter subunit PqiC [Clostridia bacterium]
MNKPCPLPRFLIAALLATILTGCAAPPAPVVYHSLLGADTGAAAAVRADGPAVVVGPVSVPDLLHNTRLATGSDGRFQLAEHHRWAGAVDREIGRALAERLAADLATERVSLFPQAPATKTAWRVQVEVLALDGLPGQWARLEVRWTLLDPDGTGPRTRRGDYRQPLTEPGHAAWVAGQRTNLARLGADIAAAIRAPERP